MVQYYAKDYREIASEKCKPFSGRLALIFLVFGLIVGAFSGITTGFDKIGFDSLSPVTQLLVSNIALAASVAELIIGSFLQLGTISITEKVNRGIEPTVGDLFSEFKGKGWNYVLIYFLKGLFVTLWTLLFIIPGFVKAYAYAMSDYIYYDDNSYKGTSAISRSQEIMEGHKWELFCLDMSYIGWILLSILTCGILFLWVEPKMRLAHYNFYLHITEADKATPKEYDFTSEDPVNQ